MHLCASQQSAHVSLKRSIFLKVHPSFRSPLSSCWVHVRWPIPTCSAMQESPLALKLNTSAAQLRSGPRPLWHRVCRPSRCNSSQTSHRFLVWMLSDKLNIHFDCFMSIKRMAPVIKQMWSRGLIWTMTWSHESKKKSRLEYMVAWRWINNTDKAWGCGARINSPHMTRFAFKDSS